MAASLRSTAFRGDIDADELHAFFQPEHQFDADTLWSFGTSLKSAYVNTYEFMNHAPVVLMWRDETDVVQAVSRLSLGTAEWFHQAAPGHRTAETTALLTRRADQAFALLTDHDAWGTVRYESLLDDVELLVDAGYRRADRLEVYMVRSLEDTVEVIPEPAGVRLALLDQASDRQMHERAMAQIDAFSTEEPTELERAWITRSLPHQVAYGRPRRQPHVIALDDSDTIVAFADVFCDQKNAIGEFEPVGTRTAAQRSGLAKQVMTRGLLEMQRAGMTQAVVRTGYDNQAAIAAYESVGFETVDHLVRFRKRRGD